MLNREVLAPIPMASGMMTRAVNPGALVSRRKDEATILKKLYIKSSGSAATSLGGGLAI
jgi:hypothetical protein